MTMQVRERHYVDDHLTISVNEDENVCWVTTHGTPWRGNLQVIRDFIMEQEGVDDEADNNSD